ncbi:MAG: hypothetical protein CMP11_00060 [Zetaproteobacteria bacterium]|nr:hypothetical protein [Pseudobdellovibrionaceae bacterium]|tara:strand:+ start:1122 stop:2009 length:888 start_codon:yes stop_codon:yes gene_type:complete
MIKENFKKNDDYQLLDSGNFRKLERFGPYIFDRPSAQAPWSPMLSKKAWQQCDAKYERSPQGQGKWIYFKKKSITPWLIHQKNKAFILKMTDFGHLGIFPEHLQIENHIESMSISLGEIKRPKFLNLFAYTGSLSLHLAQKFSCETVHLDASKTSISWARDNLEKTQINNSKIRWICDDAVKFVAREIRRNSQYEGIILDPPTYGRGQKGEIWKIEKHLPRLLKELRKILRKDKYFIVLSSHSPGYTPITLTNLLKESFPQAECQTAFELFICEDKSERKLPSGACAIFSSGLST